MRVTVIAAAVGAALIGVCAGADAQPANSRVRTDIPPEALGPALRSLAQEFGFQIVYPSKDIAALRTRGVTGNFTLEEALAHALAGTGLTFRYVDVHTITVLPIARAPAMTADPPPERLPLARERPLPAPANRETLGEVIVTAQKAGAQRLQNVPIPIAVIGASHLTSTNQFRLSEYASQVPGLSLTSTDSGGSPMLAIRGLAPAPFGNPTVGVVLDGVPLGSEITFGGGSVTPDLDPSDLKRIEVLRGPQGTLYGAASMGGLLIYNTADPSVSGFSGQAQVGFAEVQNAGNLGRNANVSINIPVTDTLAVRASGFYRWEPGYIDNIQSGVRDVNATQITGGLLSALLQPSKAFSLKLTALFNDNRQWGEPFVGIGPGFADLQQAFMPNAGRQASKTEAYIADATAMVGPMTLTSVTGYDINAVYTPLDNSINDSSFVSLAIPSPYVFEIDYVRTDKFTQELRAVTPLGMHLKWLVGAYYTHESGHNYTKYVATQPDSTPLGSFGFQSTGDGFSEWAGFTDLTYRLNDRFDIQTGGRYNRAVQTYTEVDSGLLVPLLDGVNSSSLVYPEVAATENATTYLLTPRFKLTRDIMLYARFASGFRPGGTNVGFIPADVQRAYKPDRTQNYEVGIKANLLNNRLYLEGSLYRIDWKDIQISLITPAAPTGYYSNGGRARSQGVELSLNARPLRGLHTAAWVTWDDAVLTQGQPANSAAYGVTGNRLPFGSRFSGSASIDYTVPVTSRATASVGGTLSYVGNRLGSFEPTPVRQYYPAYAKTDFHADLDFGSYTWTLYVNNAFNRRGIVGGGLGSDYPDEFYVIVPRTIGTSFRVQF